MEAMPAGRSNDSKKPRNLRPIRRLLVMMPTWFGDCLMATPTLRALREALPDARITAMIAPALPPLIDGLPWIDDILPGSTKDRSTGFFDLGRTLGAQKFDAVVLLPNSFRAALLARVAGIPRRIGYDRDGRGLLLTDRLIPRRQGRRFLPVPTLDYYLQLARYLGAQTADATMQVAVRDEDRRRAAELLGSTGRPVVLLNPGAQNPAKRWPAERYAALADRVAAELGAAVAVTGSPAERSILSAVVGAAGCEIIDLPRVGIDLHTLKAVTQRCAVMVTNDTGPRHLAAAVNTPVVTLFGPTTPAWTQIGYDREHMVVAQNAGQPDSITDIAVDTVFDATAGLLRRFAEPGMEVEPGVGAVVPS